MVTERVKYIHTMVRTWYFEVHIKRRCVWIFGEIYRSRSLVTNMWQQPSSTWNEAKNWYHRHLAAGFRSKGYCNWNWRATHAYASTPSGGSALFTCTAAYYTAVLLLLLLLLLSTAVYKYGHTTFWL